MNEKTKSTVISKEADRREIEGQVAEFLRKGGEIEQVTKGEDNTRPVGTVWRNSFASFEQVSL